MLERIQKIISAAGVTSRRAAEQLISEGRVRLNGQVVTELGTKADANKDHIKVDGKLINPRQPMTYIMLNKPAGFVTTMSDPEGRPTVQDLLKGVKIRVYPVGRLDYNTEGLLLLTNDGDFAHLITHPKHEFPKTYRAKVKGVLEESQIKTLEDGIYLDDGKTAPAKIKKVSKEEANSWLEITIHEGRKRQVRRMFDRVGHSVIKLKRVRTGNLLLGDLAEGAMRYLAPEEVEALKELAKKEVKIEARGPKPEVKRERTEERAPKPFSRSDAGFGARPMRRGSRPDVRPGRGPVRAHRDDDRRPSRGPRGAEQRSSGPISREGRAPFSATRRPRPDAGQTTPHNRRPDDKRASSYGQSSRTESTWKNAGPRVPGQGASGRGPRRSPRDETSMQSRSTAFARPGRGTATGGKIGRNTGTDRPGAGGRSQASWSPGAANSFGGKPRGKKIVAARTRGKVFASVTESKPRTERTAGAGSKDSRPRRTFGTGERGPSTKQGASRKPYRTRH